MRGLKRDFCYTFTLFEQVASFTDAWIETYFRSREQYLKRSHLLQMRGLKQLINYQSSEYDKSHLLQMRGLKRLPSQLSKEKRMSHLLQMRGLKRLGGIGRFRLFSRIFYRCVD